MPELPEIRAHAERLTRDFGGSVLQRFLPLSFTALKTAVPDPAGASGTALGEVGQRGKHLLLHFAEVPGSLTFVVHLMQGGRLRPDPRQSAKPRGGVARWVFEHDALLLTEAGTERRAGVWVVAGDAGAAEPLAHLGPEADRVEPDELARLFTEHPMRLHGFLRDQRCVAGIGRRLANEICHRARLSPFSPTAKLGLEGAAAVVEATRACVEEGLGYERGLREMSASKDRPGAVHHRVGEPCPVCGDTVRSVEYRTHVVAYCPTCQTGGRVLADNTTSKFLK